MPRRIHNARTRRGTKKHKAGRHRYHIKMRHAWAYKALMRAFPGIIPAIRRRRLMRPDLSECEIAEFLRRT